MNLEMESPGARGNAAGAELEAACEGFLTSEHKVRLPVGATHFWCPESHSIQPLRELGAVLA